MGIRPAFTFLEMILVISMIMMMASLAVIDFQALRARSEWKNFQEGVDARLVRQALYAQSLQRVEGESVCRGLLWRVGDFYQEVWAPFRQGACEQTWTAQEGPQESRVMLEGRAEAQEILFLYPPEARRLEIYESGQKRESPWDFMIFLGDEKKSLSEKARLPFYQWSDPVNPL